MDKTPITILTIENRVADFVAIATITITQYCLSTIYSPEFYELIQKHYNDIVKLARAGTYQMGILLLTGQELGLTYGEAFEAKSWGIK